MNHKFRFKKKLKGKRIANMPDLLETNDLEPSEMIKVDCQRGTRAQAFRKEQEERRERKKVEEEAVTPTCPPGFSVHKTEPESMPGGSWTQTQPIRSS